MARLPRGMRLVVYATWLTPVAAALLVQTGDWRIPATAVLGSAVLIYAGWWRVEAWLEGPGAWSRAIGATIATLVLVGWASMIIGLLIGFLMAFI